MKKRFFGLMLLLLTFPALSVCWYVAAAVTYHAVEKGCRVQSPVTQENQKKQQ